jgi:ribonuclease P protein component
VLPAAHRLRGSADFAATIRTGRRAGAGTLVVHALATGRENLPRAGIVVSGKVGNSVVRHRVTRRLRPLVRERLRNLPAGAHLVVRALPSAATAGTGELAADLSLALRRAGLRPTRPGDLDAEPAR